MNLLTLEESAQRLRISKASLKNWEKQEIIKSDCNGMYSELDVTQLIYKIRDGEIQRLSSRANKKRSTTRFIPTEYIDGDLQLEELEAIIDFIREFNIKPEQALFLLAINQLVSIGELKRETLYQSLKFNNPENFKRFNLYNELKEWFSEIGSREIKEENKYCRFLLECKLPEIRDVLGVIYQSIIVEGKKSSMGSYYTPLLLVESIVEDNLKELDEGRILDPCCGTGQFLLSVAQRISDPHRIVGADLDSTAVRITRINLFIHYSDIDFKPAIYNINSLKNWNEDGFSLIITNPPWGAAIAKEDLKIIKKNFPEIASRESFSYFLAFALKFLKNGGRFSYVLPESLLYVKNHQDIRSLILENSQIQKIESCGRLFKNVFTPVFRIDSIKGSFDSDQSSIVPQERFLNNPFKIMDIYCSNEDQQLIDKIYTYPHTTLENRARWALGIVTGNNKRFLSEDQKAGMEPIYKGKDLLPMVKGNPSAYIEYRREDYQQCATEEHYRAPEKLIYKFISKDLVFSYDDEKSLTLNSANILIPEISELNVKSICAILNSKVIRFIYIKKFNALKVLRGNLEMLPIPLLKVKEIDELTTIIESNGNIDNFFYNLFELSQEEIDKICIITES